MSIEKGFGGNRFAAFTPAPEAGTTAPVQQQKQAPKAPPKEAKKITIKPKKDQPKVDDGQGEFADVNEKQNVKRERANPRENRGRRGGDEDGERRGGEGRGRGGGRGRGDGERRPRGDGGPRRGGRGDGRDRVRNQAVDEDGNPTTDGAEAGGYRKGYQGKPREGDHPFDRKSGTGRGKRDDRRQGGRDGWGGDKE